MRTRLKEYGISNLTILYIVAILCLCCRMITPYISRVIEARTQASVTIIYFSDRIVSFFDNVRVVYILTFLLNLILTLMFLFLLYASHQPEKFRRALWNVNFGLLLFCLITLLDATMKAIGRIRVNSMNQQLNEQLNTGMTQLSTNSYYLISIDEVLALCCLFISFIILTKMRKTDRNLTAPQEATE